MTLTTALPVRKNYMRKAISVLLLLIASAPALADWSKIISSANSTGYADLKTLQKKGSISAMRVLIDFKKPPFDGNNLPYLSLKMDMEYDCAANQFRAIKTTSFAGHMATGSSPYTSFEPDVWKTPSSASMQKTLWEIACANESETAN
jgi:hypothetical protein